MKIPVMAALCLQTVLSAQMAAWSPDTPMVGKIDLNLMEFEDGLSTSRPARGQANSLGWGVKGSTGEIKLKCISGADAQMPPVTPKSSIVYEEVHTKSQLRELTKRDFSASASVAFASWGVSASMASRFESEVKVTTENITIVGKVDYSHGSLVINNPDDLVVSEKAKDMYKKNYPKFYETYGDGFISKVDLGECIYFVCQTTMSSSCKYTKSEIRAAMNAKFMSILNVNGSGGQVKDLEEKLSQSSFSFRAFTTGTAFLAQTVSNKADFDALIAKLQQHISDKKPNNDYSVLRAYITPYPYVMDKTEDPVVAENIEKMMKWYGIREKVQSVLEHYTTDPGLQQECKSALEAVDGEIKKFHLKQSGAKAPKGDEFWRLQVLSEDIGAANLVARYFDASGRVTTAIWTASGSAAHPEARCDVGMDYVVVGGGAWAQFGGHGALLTASYPLNPDLKTWVAKSKDHLVSDPHTLRVYAMGMKLAGVERNTLMKHMTVRTSTSGTMQHPNAAITLPGDYQLIGGGARLDYAEPGNLLTESYPLNASTWAVGGKDHMQVSQANITAYGIGIKREPIPGFGSLEVRSRQTAPVATSQYKAGTAAITLENGYVPVSLGGMARGGGVGRLLYRLGPDPDYSYNFITQCKDHHTADSGQLTGFLVEVKKLP